ncbi:Nucleolar gtp-binding protein 1-like isoform x1, partial [Globisporangium splendens]
MAARKTADAVAHGALQRLPYVYTASEIQEMKFWRMAVRESNKIADPIRRSKNQTSRLINAQLSKLSGITRQASLDFPALKRMHPFEREVVVLTLGQGTYEHNVQKLRKVYAALHNTGKQHERACQEVRTKQEALDCGLRCIDELKEVVDENAPTLRQVAEMTKTLRGLPYVDVEKPIFAFVGAPNVGKSSLVRALSTASPEIADTPGLIYRPDAKRNAIEKLALAMMEKTKASIGFVFDPTGASGTTVEDQLLLRDELHGRVSKARDDLKWLDIISKVDQPIPELPALQKRLGPSSLTVSAQTNMGLVELGDEIRRMVVSEEQVADEELQS